MQEQTSQQVRVGLFVFTGLILVVVVIFLLGGGFGFFDQNYHLNGQFKDISGLRLGAPVYVAGINVGLVDDITFAKDLSETDINVRFKINVQYKDRIREDSQASIQTLGLLGDKAIFITVGKPEFPVLKDRSEIQVKQGKSLDALASNGSDLIENVNNLAKNIDGLITDIKREKGLMHSLIYEKEGQILVGQLAKVATNTNRILEEVQHGKGVLHALIYDPVKKDIGKSFSETADNFRAISGDFRAMSTRMNKGEGSIGGLMNDPSVYYDLMTLLGKANRNKLLRTVIRATLSTNEKDLQGGK